MALIVQKFGGSSVGNIDKIKHVASKVAKTRAEGHDVVVVVSAMQGETDRLIGLSAQITKSPVEREMDMLLSSGERVTASLLAITLSENGYPAVSLTGRQSGIITDSAYTKARIKSIETARLREALNDGRIVVVAGFQGIDPESNVTTLGRGGSDTTAVALAAALKADKCEIYTDVPGVFTADPNIVPGAKMVARMAYDEMLELASLGAKVLQTRSVEIGKKYNVPILVLSTFEDGPGTLVTKEEPDMEDIIVSGVTSDKNQVRLTLAGVPDKPGIAAKIFRNLAEGNIVVDMIIQNISEHGVTDLSFTVPKTDAVKAEGVIKGVQADLGAKSVLIDPKISKVSIVGVGMRSHSGIAARMFSILSAEGINILMISTSEIKISCVIEEKYTELAVRTLHDEFIGTAEKQEAK